MQVSASTMITCLLGAAGNARRWANNHPEQLRSGGHDEPVRGRGPGEGPDRICAYRSCRRSHERRIVVAIDRPADLRQREGWHAADAVKSDDRNRSALESI